jgi:hypothetical protein
MITIQVFDHKKFKKRDQGMPLELVNRYFIQLALQDSLGYTTCLLRRPFNLLARSKVITR